MKSEAAVKRKLNQVRFRHMKKRIEAELRQTPDNCVYNAVVPAPSVPLGVPIAGMEVNVPVPVPDRNPVGLAICLHGAGDPATWVPTFCDEQVDGGDRARRCEKFCSRRTKDEVKAEFSRELEGLTLPEVAYRYPDMAALIWVLDDGEVPAHDDSSEDVPSPAPAPVPVPSPVPVVVESPAVDTATVADEEPTDGGLPRTPAETASPPPPAEGDPDDLMDTAVRRDPWWARWFRGVV